MRPPRMPNTVSATVCVSLKYVAFTSDHGLTTMMNEYRYVFVR